MKTTVEKPERTSPPLRQVPGKPLPQSAQPRWGTEVSGTDRAQLWAARSAMAGAAVWAAMAVLARMGMARIGAVELLFLFAPLVIAPLGIELGRMMGGGGPLEEVVRQMQPFGAALAVAALWRPVGRAAGLAAVGWMGVCLLVAADGMILVLSALRREARGGARDTLVTLAIARIDLAVGGAWLVASRLGMRPLGIQEPMGLLTAVHFHFAGFATATIAAATLDFAERRGKAPWLHRTVIVVAGLPFVVAAGFVISAALKLAAAVAFSASVAVLAVFLRSVASQATHPTARVLLQVAAGAIFAGVLMSAAYAVADFSGSEALTIPQMARTHGILNSVGFGLPGLLGWLLEISSRS